MSEEVFRSGGFAATVSGEKVAFGPGAAGKVEAKGDAAFERGGALTVTAGRDLQFSGGGALTVSAGRDVSAAASGMAMTAVGHDLTLSNSVAGMIRAGGSARVDHSFTLVSCSGQASAQGSFVGLALAREVSLGEGTRVLLNTPQAIALGAAFGAVFGLLGWLLRRR